MFIYLLNLAVIAILSFFIRYVHDARKGFLLRLGLIYLFVISSLRSREIGTDYSSYVDTFYHIAKGGSSYMEGGYILLNRIIARFTSNYIALAVCVNLLLLIPLYHYITKTVNKRWWGLCLFIFTANPYMYVQSTFNILRQSCATGMILIGLNVLINRKKTIWSVLLFYLMIILGAQFHRSAYFMGIVPIILFIKWKKAYWYVLMTAAVVFNLIGWRVFLAFAINRFDFAAHYLGIEASPLNNPVYILFVLLVIMFLLSHYDTYGKIRENGKRIIDLYLFSLCFLIMTLPNDVMFRVYIMLSYCALPGVPLICQSTKNNIGKIKIRYEHLFVQRLYIFYYLSFYIGFFSLLAINRVTKYIPFRFFFQ